MSSRRHDQQILAFPTQGTIESTYLMPGRSRPGIPPGTTRRVTAYTLGIYILRVERGRLKYEIFYILATYNFTGRTFFNTFGLFFNASYSIKKLQLPGIITHEIDEFLFLDYSKKY